MSEKNERPKPPARRTGGRALGVAKKATPPPLRRPPSSRPSSSLLNRPLARAKTVGPLASRRFRPSLPPFPPRGQRTAGPRQHPKWRSLPHS